MISKFKDGECRLPFNIPYVSQYASAERAEEFIRNEDLLKTDSRWRDFGAANLDEYVFWAPKICGMACFQMIVKSQIFGHPMSDRTSDVPLIILAKKAMAAGCYLPDPKNSKRLIGLLHKPFLKFAKSFGFDGKLIWYIGPNAVAREILKKNFVIASVSNQIRHASARPDSKQGHLILVHGFQVSGGEVQGFYIHNPSGFFGISQENHFVPVEDFVSCFSGRIIVLSSNHGRI